MSVANHLTLIGNLGKKPRAIETSTDNPMVSFSLAVAKPFNGEEQPPDWFKIVAFGKTALRCFERLDKGMRVLIEGRLTTHTWLSEEGKEQTSIEVVANEVHLLTPLWQKKEVGGELKPIEPEEVGAESFF